MELDLPWAVKTRQQQGAVTEKRFLKRIGARQHPRSGAGRIKHDGSDDDTLYEVKDARRSFTLKAEELRGLYLRAVRQDKTPMLVVHYSDYGFTAMITLVPGGAEVIA